MMKKKNIITDLTMQLRRSELAVNLATKIGACGLIPPVDEARKSIIHCSSSNPCPNCIHPLKSLARISLTSSAC